MEGLRLEDIKENKKLTDPRITMELRHKQVSRQGSTVQRNKTEDYRIRVDTDASKDLQEKPPWQ